MSWDEHVMLIAHTVNTFGSQLQVIGNTGSNSTREALHATEQGFAVGMDAALQINPYYGKTSLDGLMAHFTAVLHEGPTIIYNVPSRTGIALRIVYTHKQVKLKCPAKLARASSTKVYSLSSSGFAMRHWQCSLSDIDP